jgi:myosin heavy subunit
LFSKTETVKICLNHIASVQRGKGCYESGHDPVVTRVVESNPLLEAFGNAKTRRNDNSSRFGKYLQLQFQKGSTTGLVGSKCDVYLLEKNRVISHTPEERNFHIFYQLLASDDAVKGQFWTGLRGTRNETFRYVGPTKTDTIEGMTDADRFQETVQALSLVGVKGESLTVLMQAICIVMQLGNLTFKAKNGDTDQSAVASVDALKSLSGLMGVSSESLELCLTERTLVTDKETYKVLLNPEAAAEARDALAKESYQKLFLWLVNKINVATCADESKGHKYSTIGLLDIFGFESFPHNRFEQLCINYANEKLQQKFNEDIFKNVQAECKAEGIDLSEITYDDNTDVLDLIEGRSGLLNLLNEECIRPQGNDLDYVHKALRINAAAPALIVHKTDRLSFGIQHYAGMVMYDADLFVTKNLDTLPTDLQACIENSSNYILNTARSEPEPAAKGRFSRKESNITAPTVWTKYKNQLSSLMTNLRKTKSRYIRCIKPNTKKEAYLMEHKTTIEQLRCAGVVAGITIARSSFPNRLPNSTVLARYSNMWDMKKYPSKKTPNMTIAQQRQCDCQALMQCALAGKSTVDANGKVVQPFAVGTTKTFFRSGALEFLESGRMTGLDDQAAVIQRFMRGWLARNGGRHDRERKEMEEAMRAANRRAEEERLAKLARERAARKAERQKVFDNLESQIEALQGATRAYADKQDKKIKDLNEQNRKNRSLLNDIKAANQREYSEMLNRNMITLAEQHKQLEENEKLIAYLMKENKRARKEHAKVADKHGSQKGRNDMLDKKNKEMLVELDDMKDDTCKTEAANQHLKDSIAHCKVVHDDLHLKLKKQQELYLKQAQARLKLQKATAKMLSIIQAKVTDRTVVEESVVNALKAESMSKSTMAALDVASLQPDLTGSDFSDSESEHSGSFLF